MFRFYDSCSFIAKQPLFGIVHGTLHNFISDGCNQDAHQRADNVEKAIGKVRQRRYVQYRRLRHSTGIPGYQRRSDGDGIFRCAAQQPVLISFFLINVAEHISGKDDTDILVGSGEIEKQSRTNGGGHHTHPAFHEAYEDGCNAAQHAACRHCAAETHGTKYQPDRIHHARHATGGDKVGQHRVSRVQAGASVECHHYAFKYIAHSGNFPKLFWMEDDSAYPCQQSREEQGDDGRSLPCNKYSGHYGDNQQPGSDVESAIQ